MAVALTLRLQPIHSAAALAMTMALLTPLALRCDEQQPRMDAADAPQGAAEKEDQKSLARGADRSRAEPLKDSDGARWKVQTGQLRDASILGRPSRFAVNNQFVFAPMGNFVIKRLNDSGMPAIWYRALLPAPVRQTVMRGANDLACVLGYRKNEDPGDNVLLFSAIEPSEMQPLAGQKLAPWRLLPSPHGGSRLVACADDGTIRLWEFLFKRPRLVLTMPGDSPDDAGNAVHGEFAAFSPHGRWLATVHRGEISLRTADNGVKIATWTPTLSDSQSIRGIRFDTNGNNVLAFTEDKKDDGAKRLRFVQVNIQTQIQNGFEGTRPATWGFALPGDKTVVTYNGASEISVWDVDKREESVAFKAAPEHVFDMQIAPSGDTVATVGDDNVVKLWDTANWKQRETKLGYKHEGAKVITFSPDGKYLVTLSEDGWLKCWDAPDFAAEHRLNVVRTEGDPTGVWTEYYSDGSAKQRFPDWTVRETLPDGTVKIYMQQ